MCKFIEIGFIFFLFSIRYNICFRYVGGHTLIPILPLRYYGLSGRHIRLTIVNYDCTFPASYVVTNYWSMVWGRGGTASNGSRVVMPIMKRKPINFLGRFYPSLIVRGHVGKDCKYLRTDIGRAPNWAKSNRLNLERVWSLTNRGDLWFP